MSEKQNSVGNTLCGLDETLLLCETELRGTMLIMNV